MSDFDLKAPKGANRKKKCLGRGKGTGLGKTSGRGHNGQNSRSGGGVKIGFEGGQMPLFRRIASRGFSNHPFKNEYLAVNLDQLEDRFNDGDKVNLETLAAKGLIKRSEKLVKILASGEITKKLEVEAVNVSASAKEKIEKAGGKVL